MLKSAAERDGHSNGKWHIQIHIRFAGTVYTNVGSVGLTPENTQVLPSAEAPFTQTDIHFLATNRGCRLELPLQATEQIYGLGLQMKSFRQNGKKKQLRVNSDPIADTGDSHAPVPLYVSTAGYAVFVDTLRYACFYIGSHTHLQREAQEETSIADNTNDLYAAHENIVVVEIPAAAGVDIWLFAGPTMAQAIQRYNLFSGGGYLPPVWGLGMWYRAYAGADEAKVWEYARMLRQEHIPCDVIGLEPGWQTHAYSCTYAFDRDRYSEPETLLDELAQQQFHVSLWEHIFVHPDAAIYADLKPFAGDYPVWGGLVPDYAVPEATEIYAKHHRESLAEMRISGFKLDECDNFDYVASPWSYPEMSQFPSGLDGEQMHMAMGNLYIQAVEKVFEPLRYRTLGSVRSEGAFAAKYPFVLYSDLYDQKYFFNN